MRKSAQRSRSRADQRRAARDEDRRAARGGTSAPRRPPGSPGCSSVGTAGGTIPLTSASVAEVVFHDMPSSRGHVGPSDAGLIVVGAPSVVETYSRMRNFPYGLKQEDRVAAALRRRGHSTGYYPASRGPVDITADRGGLHLDLQVKSVRARTARIETAADALTFVLARVSSAERTRLRLASRRSGRRPALALVNGDYHWIFVLSGRDVTLYHHGWLPRKPLAR